MAAIVFLILRLLIAGGLYAFLGWILFTLWREIQKESHALSPTQLPHITLVEEESGKSQTFQQLEVLIGRDLTCDLCLADHAVSGKHARLFYRQGQWWVEDLNSTNGTRLNELPVSQPMVITFGDQIWLGQVKITIER